MSDTLFRVNQFIFGPGLFSSLGKSYKSFINSIYKVFIQANNIESKEKC